MYISSVIAIYINGTDISITVASKVYDVEFFSVSRIWMILFMEIQ